MLLQWHFNTTTRWITPDASPWRKRCIKTMQLYATCPLLMAPQSTCSEICQSSQWISQGNKLTKRVRPQHSWNSRSDKYAGRSTFGSSQRRFQPYPRGKSSDFLGKSRFSKLPRKKKDGETSQRQWRCLRYVMQTWHLCLLTLYIAW